MARQDLPIPILAKLNLAMAPEETDQLGSPHGSTTVAIAAGNGVDVSGVLWALVEVRPSGGNALARIKGRALYLDGTMGDYGDVGGTADLDVSARGWTQIVNCALLAELAVDLVGGTATEVVIKVSPCKGGLA